MKKFIESLQKIWNVLLKALPWLLVLTAPAILFRLIAIHQVNIPFMDDWMFVHQFEKLPNGFLWTLAKDDVHLTIHDFFRVQMEHRLAFVRVVILALHKLWPTNYTNWMWLSWVIMVLTYNNIAILLRRTTGLTFRGWWPLLALAGLAIFSPLQYRVVLWAMMFQVALPAFFLSAALVVFTSRWPTWVKWIVGVICASLGTQTIASGLLIWVLPLPLIFWGGAIEGRRARWIFTIAWTLVFAVTVKLYFTDLLNEEDHAFSYGTPIGAKALEHDTSAFFKEPGRSIPYVMRFLGNHLGRGNGFALMDAALWTGAASFALFTAAFGYFLMHFRRKELRHRLLPWLLFGSYSIACAMLVCMGRLHASASGDNALAPRYIIHAVPLTVSLIALGWLIGRDLLDRKSLPRMATILPCSGAVLMVLLLLPWPYGIRLMEMWESARLRGATTTLFLNTSFADNMVDHVPCNRYLAKKANSLGLLERPMLNSTRLDQFKINQQSNSTLTAQWSDLTIERDRKNDAYVCKVRGHAFLSRRTRVADGIFFTYKNKAEGRHKIFHVEQVAAMPTFLLETLSRDIQFVHIGGDAGDTTTRKQESVSKFDGQFPLDLLPEGRTDVFAWAFDYRQKLVRPIIGRYRIDTEKKTALLLKEAQNDDNRGKNE